MALCYFLLSFFFFLQFPVSAHSYSQCPSLFPFISSHSSKISSFHSPTLDAFSWCLSPSAASWAPTLHSPPPSPFTFHTFYGLHHFSHRFPVPSFSQIPSSSCLAVEQGSVATSLQILLSQGGAGANLTAAVRKPHCVGAEIWAQPHQHSLERKAWPPKWVGVVPARDSSISLPMLEARPPDSVAGALIAF